MRSLLLGLAACSSTPVVADLNLVVIDSGAVSATDATVALDRLVLEPCDGAPIEVLVGYRLDLRHPEPVPVPVDSYCSLALDLAPDPFDGALRLSGSTSGRDFSLALDPGLVVRERDQPFVLDDEALLALDLALWLGPPELDAIDTLDPPASVAPDDPLAEDLADTVGDALVFLASPDEGRAVYVDLWPDFDLSVDARVDTSGCNRNGPVVYEPPDVDPPSPVDVPEPDPSPTSDEARGCSACRGDGDGGCGGCRGSDGDGGCGCGGGCSAECSTVGFTPALWTAFLATLVLRRRRSDRVRNVLGHVDGLDLDHGGDVEHVG